MTASRPPAIAVIDLGKTNLKLVLVCPERGRALGAERSDNRPRPGPPYPHADSDAIMAGLVSGLAAAAGRFDIQAIVPCAYGSTAALVDPERGPDGDGLVLPVMDYEAEPPADLARTYAAAAPPFGEVYAPTNPAGLTLARQLWWQESAWPEAFARTRAILPWAQYWTWRLTGTLASEITSLGAQTHLWAPREGRFSSLARERGWNRLFPPIRPAGSAAGPLRPDLAARTGVAPGTPVLVGVHDSNANYLRYRRAGLERFTLLSTGTWLITFDPTTPLDRLDPARDTCSNTDTEGRTVATSRFMAGREYALIAGDAAGVPAGDGDVAAVLRAGTLALPSFTDSGGPCPGTGGRGRIEGPAPATAAERAALATLYCALMSSLALDAVGAGSNLIVDGGFAENPLYARLIGALRPGSRVRVSAERDGPAIGAACLAGPEDAVLSLDLAEAPPIDLPGLAAYAERWRRVAGTG